jgi:hypothetical protein
VNRSSAFRRGAWLTSLVIFIAAEAGAAKVEVHGCGAALSPVPAKEVRLYGAEEALPAGARVIGVLATTTSGPRGLTLPRDDYWAGLLRGPAGHLGAEGMAGLHSFYFAGEGRYFATALALTMRGEADSTPCPLLVALEPVTNTTVVSDVMRKRDVETLRIAFSYALGRCGWYVVDGWQVQDPAAAAWLAHRLTVELEPASDTPASQRGFVRIRATLTGMDGRVEWSDQETEEFMDLTDIAGMVLFGTMQSRSGHLLAATERLVQRAPLPAAETLAGGRDH